MPDPTLTAAIKEAYASAPSNVVVYHTLEIWHSAFSAPIRVVRDWQDLSATLESTAPRNPSTEVTFVGYAFDIMPPEVTVSGFPTCTIEIDNVSRDILAQIESAMTSTSSITVIYRQFVSTDLSAPQNNPPLTLTIFSIEATPMRIRATAGFGDLANKKFPSALYTADVFPGLIAQ